MSVSLTAGAAELRPILGASVSGVQQQRNDRNEESRGGVHSHANILSPLQSRCVFTGYCAEADAATTRSTAVLISRR